MGDNIDIEAYRTSGILEEYVLGTLPEKKAQEVSLLIEKHPQLEEEVQEIEAALFAYSSAFAAGQEPQEDLLTAALSQLPETPVSPAPETQESTPETPIRSLSPFQRYASIAAVGLLLFSVGLNLFFYSQWQNTSQELTAIQDQNNQVLAETETLKARLNASDDLLAQMGDPRSQNIQLNGLEIAPESGVLISWNADSRKVLLVRQNLPPAPTDFQYQLWAIVDGKPVSAGLLEGSGSQFMSQLAAGEPVAFAITLEQKGGSEIPTLDKMYVYGELAG